MADNSAKRVVWWFSGTGNSLVVARELAERLGARLEPMTRALERGAVALPAELAVLVFPVYFGAIPAIVARFAASLAEPSRCRITAVATYGGGAGESYGQLDEILAVRGGKLHARYGLHLPQSAFNKFWENPLSLFRKASKRVEGMAAEIAAGQPIQSLDQAWMQPILGHFRQQIRGANRRSLLAKAGLADDSVLSNRQLIGPSDHSYRVTEACTGCGLCARLCPVGNLRLEAGKPVWQGRCEACLACYHFCPVQAVSGGIAFKGYFYRNPMIQANELLVQHAALAHAPKEA